MHRNPDQQIAASADGGSQTPTLAANHDGDRTPEVCLSGRQRGIPIRANDLNAPDAEACQGSWQVVHRRQQEVLHGPRRGFHRGRRERRLAARWEQCPMDPRCLGAPKQGADILGILERIEREHQRRLATLLRQRKDVVERRPPTGTHNERHALVAIEPCDRRQRATLDLDDRDPQAGCMQDQLLQREPALRDDQEPDCLPPGDERLLNRTSPGDKLLALGQPELDARPLGTTPGRLGQAGTVTRAGSPVEGT